jgi:hypothetical protein
VAFTPASSLFSGVVSGTVAVSNFPASQPVTGPLTNAELRAAAVPVDASGFPVPITAAALPLPAGAATEATLAALEAEAATEATLETLATEETLERAAGSLDDVGLTAILEREQVPAE